MGVHARRVARRKTPFVAAAAGIGTVAAMLTGPVPASAAGLVLDPTYGGRDGVATAGAFSGNTAGLIPARGVDAVDVGASPGGPPGQRVVLGQDGSGLHRVSLTKFKRDGTIDDAFGGGTGQVEVAVPTGTTVSHLLSTDGTDYWIVGRSAAGLVVIHLDLNGAPLDGPAAPVPGAALGLAPGSTYTIVDAEAHSRGGSGAVVALNVVSSGGVPSARVVRFLATGTVDADVSPGGGAPATGGFGVNGSYLVPGAMSVGGIAVRPGSASPNDQDIVGTFQSPSVDPSAEPSGQSGVFEIDPDGVPQASFHGSGPAGGSADPNGISMAIERYADATAPPLAPGKSAWTTEALGDLIPTGNNGTDLLVAGRVGSSSFLANLDATGDLRASDFGRFGGGTGTGGGGITIVATGCNAGPLPQVVESSAYYYLANVCGDNHAELIRVSPTGVPDTNFNGGSAIWRVSAPVNARPVTISNEQLRIGSANTDGSDVATAAFAEASAPGVPIVTADNVVVGAGNPVTFYARPNPGDPGTPAPTFRWEKRGNPSLRWLPVLGSPNETISGATSNTLRIKTTGSMDGSQYRAIAVNPAGESPSIETDPLTVLPIAPVITQQPTSQSGAIDGTVMFTAAATSDPPATWTWQSQAPGDPLWHDVTNGGPNVMGADSPVLTIKNITAAQAGTHYRATAVAGGYEVTTDGTATLTIGGVVPPPPPHGTHHAPGDFNGDGTSDVVTFRPSDGSFHWADGTADTYGAPGDKPVIGDYNGDGKTDVAVYRPSNGVWYIEGQPSVAFGRSTDKPVPGDYTGDGKTDPAVYRPSSGMWYVKGMNPIAFGRATDIPVPADYNGDGKTDIALYRPSNGMWYFLGGAPVPYGRSTDVPVPADYNGDGQAEIALFRPSNLSWYIISKDPVAFGQHGDVPASGDFNGDGMDDIAVYHPYDSTYNVRGSNPVHVGNPGDRPMPH